MRKKSLWVIFMAVLMFLSVSSLFADKKKEEKETFKTKESQFGEIIEVVGSVPLLKTVQSVSVSNRKEIKTMNAKSLNEVLNLIPGLFTLSTGQSGQGTNTFIRGSSSTQILYIIDGIKIRDYASISGINLGILSPGMIDRVEVVRGPLSNIYGSGAQGGVISINTDNSKKASFSGSYGNHNSYDGSLSLFKNIGDFDLSLSLNSRRYSNNIENDLFNNSGVSAKFNYKKDGVNAGLRYFGSFTNSGVPLTWDLKQSLDTKYSQNYNMIAIPVILKLSEKTSLKFNGSFVKSHYTFDDKDAYFNFQSKILSNSFTFETTLNTKINQYLSIRSGLEYSNNDATNETDDIMLINKFKSNVFATFIHGDINLNNLLFFASIRYDKYKDVKSNISPQFGFSYLINNRFKIRASYSNSFKTPLITQQINPWGESNFDLRPEKAKSYEVGINYFSKFVSFEITYFNNTYEDMINWVTVDMTTFSGQYQNTLNVDSNGYEFSATLRPTSQITLQGSYTNLNTEDLGTNLPLKRRPKHTFSGLMVYRSNIFTASVQFVYVGKRSDTDTLSWPPLTESPSFNTFNFNVLVPVTESLQISGKITNALNTVYSEVFGYRSPKRRFELGFRYTIQ